MSLAKKLMLALCLVCVLATLALASKRDIEKINSAKCASLSKNQTCLACCKEAGFNGYDEKRSFGCLCMQFTGGSPDIIMSLSEVMSAEAGH